MLTPKRFNYGSHPEQFCDLYLTGREDLQPVVILVHGGYWKVTHTLNSYPTFSLIPYFLNMGFAVWNVEYRRMEAEGENTLAPWPAVFEDIGNAADLLGRVSKHHNLDGSHIFSIGHSAGGCLALWLCGRQNISALSPLYRESPLAIKKAMSIAGVIDLRRHDDLSQPEQITRLLGGSYDQVADRYKAANPAQLLDEACEYYIVHGNEDETVAIDQLKYWKDENAKKVLIQGADHFSMLPDFSMNSSHWFLLNQSLRKCFMAEDLHSL